MVAAVVRWWSRMRNWRHNRFRDRDKRRLTVIARRERFEQIEIYVASFPVEII
jgi:hypothetical protein